MELLVERLELVPARHFHTWLLAAVQQLSLWEYGGNWNEFSVLVFLARQCACADIQRRSARVGSSFRAASGPRGVLRMRSLVLFPWHIDSLK